MRKLLRALLLTVALGGAVYGSYYVSFHPPERFPENRIPAAALRALEESPHVVLYSLNPLQYVRHADGTWKKLGDEVSKFHGYQILGETMISSAEVRRMAAAQLRQGTRDWRGWTYLCFNPRHGIRARDASGTHDFVICFECDSMDIYSPHGERGFGISSSGGLLNRLLVKAGVPRPKN